MIAETMDIVKYDTLSEYRRRMTQDGARMAAEVLYGARGKRLGDTLRIWEAERIPNASDSDIEARVNALMVMAPAMVSVAVFAALLQSGHREIKCADYNKIMAMACSYICKATSLDVISDAVNAYIDYIEEVGI